MTLSVIEEKAVRQAIYILSEVLECGAVSGQVEIDTKEALPTLEQIVNNHSTGNDGQD